MKKTTLIALRSPKDGSFWFDVFEMALFEDYVEALAWAKEQKIPYSDIEFVEVEVVVKRTIPKEEVDARIFLQASKVSGGNNS